jgi:hypothetical protein
LRPALIFAFACALPLFAGQGIAAATITVNKLAFVPARFLVGEEVEAWALVSVSGAEPQSFSVKAGDGLPSASAQADPELRSLSLARGSGGWELRMRFIAWSPGAGRLPALEVRGYAIPAMEYTANSVLGPQDRDAAPPKPQLDPPGTALYLYGFAGLALILVLLVLGTVLYVVPAAASLLSRRQAAQARRALGRSLAFLSRTVPGAAPAAFYAALARALRIYLGSRVLPEAPALTPSEFSALGEERFPGPGIRDEAAALLAETDAVRYAGEAADESRMRRALSRAVRLGDAAEEALDARL